MAYRAFGVKQMNYGNGKTLSMQFDNRMRVTDWSVPNVLGWQYSYTDAAENTGRVMFAKNTASSTASGGGRDDTLDRSFDYDHLGRLIVSHSGYEARLHMGRQQTGDPTTYGPYSQSYVYDQWGNMNGRVGWGGWNGTYINWVLNYSNDRLTTNPATGATLTYDASGNLTYDGYQTFTYDATGQQATSSGSGLSHGYDGDRLRVKKVENSVTTYYLRSTVLGGQVVAELNASGAWTRGFVYLGDQMLAIHSGGVNWVHQDPVTKSQRVTNSSGTVVSAIDLDPWGGETASSSNQAFQPHRFTTYERDANGGDEAMMRRYAGSWMRFSQPDPYDGSYSLRDPQSFNRYSYVHNDPVNFIDPTGLDECQDANGNIIPCGPDPEIDPRDIHTINTSAPRVNDYVLPAWMSGHPPMTITLLQAPGVWNPGAGPQDPTAHPTPTPQPSDPCDSNQNTAALQQGLNKIASILGGKLDSQWNIRVPETLTVETAATLLEDSGFSLFKSYNSEHPGANLQGMLDGRWYHVTVSPFPSLNAAVNANRQPPTSGRNAGGNTRSLTVGNPIQKVTAHCEKNKPTSAAHFWDYVKSRIW